MLFSDSIPSKLQEQPNVSSFLKVLDGLQGFKNGILAESFRVNNYAVLMDRNWLLKKLSDYGVNNLPEGFPIQIIRQCLLNIDTICGTRGSKIGIELYCSVLSFGEVTLDDSKFYADTNILLLDSTIQGYITEDNSEQFFHIVEDNSVLNPETELKITIKSKYFNGKFPTEATTIKKYLECTIKNQIGFSNAKVIFDYQPRSEFYFHGLLNSYFV